MENSTAERKGPSDNIKIIWISVKAILIVAIIFGNSLVFKAFHKFSSLRTASNSILVSLSVANSLTVVAFILHITFIASFTLGENMPPTSSASRLLCKSSACLSFVLIAVIILHLALISVERFIAVKFALRYHTIVTHRRAVVASLLVWLWAVAVAFVFPQALREDSSEDAYERLYQALHPCHECREQPLPPMPLATKGYLIFLVVSLLVIPILIILSSYGYVFALSCKHRKQIKAEQVTSKESDIRASDIQGNSAIKVELKGARTLAIVVGVCLLSFVPLLVVTSYRFFGSPQVIRNPWLKNSVYDVAIGLNACLNPLIYGWRNEKFRKAFLKLLKCT